MSNNKRILKMYEDNFSNYKEQANRLYNLNTDIKYKINAISKKLIQFVQNHCKEEYISLISKYKIEESIEYGIQIVPLDKEDKSLVYKLEKCIDRNIGINKLITIYEIDSKNLTIEDDNCKRKCISEADKLSDEELTSCFSTCMDKFYSDYLELSINYETKLNKIYLSI